MTAVHAPTLLVSLSLALLLAWRLHARIRRLISRQRLSLLRLRIRLSLLPLVLVALAVHVGADPAGLLALAAGALGGALLGDYGIRLTRFEDTNTGLYYTPSLHIGIALSALLVARIAYRLYELYLAGPALMAAPDHFLRSPLTLAVFGLLAGYYLCYAMGLRRWWKDTRRTSSGAGQ